MSTTQQANDFLKLWFLGTALTGIADAAASPIASVGLSLHTANPGAAGSQSTSLTAYTGYAHLAAARNSGVWTITDNVCVNAIDLVWPLCTSGSSTITHVGASWNGVLRFRSATLASSLVVVQGVLPRIAAGLLVFTVPTGNLP